MTDDTAKFVTRCRRAIREITDPAELQRQLQEMVEEEFPVSKPVFETGETLKMHEFLARYQSQICGGVVPKFYDANVVVVDAGEQAITFALLSEPRA